MILTNIQNVVRTNPTQSAVNITEWATYTDLTTGKQYHKSRVYTVHIYTARAQLETYTNKHNIDLYC